MQKVGGTCHRKGSGEAAAPPSDYTNPAQLQLLHVPLQSLACHALMKMFYQGGRWPQSLGVTLPSLPLP